jgi:alpha-beta hydrolase superfamily lysophospholipase
VPYLFGITTFLAAILSTLILFIHLGFRAPRIQEQKTPAELGMDYQEVSIPAQQGKQLFAWFLPGKQSAPTIIILHGWGGNAELMLPLAHPFYQAGMNVLLIDARNHGRSDSSGHSSIPRFAQDIDSAMDWLTQHRSGKVILLGHSVGGGAVLFSASRRKDISAVISISAFAHPQWMMLRYLGENKIPVFLSHWILKYVEWLIGHRFDEIAPMNTACNARCPVLLVHGDADKTVSVSDAHTIKNNCKDKIIQLLLIEGADHDSVDKIEDHAHQLINFLEKNVLHHPPLN